MAATARTSQRKSQRQKLSLVSKIELSSADFNDAVFIPHEDAVITVSTDK